MHLKSIRAQFPALSQTINGLPAIFFDGPGGTQVPSSVSQAMIDYYQQGNSNLGGQFSVSKNTVNLVNKARSYVATLLAAHSPSEIVFGANMTTLTLHFSRSISQDWQAGDEIILSEIDHGANRSCWALIAKEKGVKVHYLPIINEDCQLDLSQLEQLLSHKTKLVAVSAASNVSGTITDIKMICQQAHQRGALVYIDAVHLLPHQLIDVCDIDCDFLAGSAYKFFGPHLGFVYGKSQHLNYFKPYKVEPAPVTAPHCWETGTLNFAALAGVVAAIDYIASLGAEKTTQDLRSRLISGYQAIIKKEQRLATYFLSQLTDLATVQLYGFNTEDTLNKRTATFALRFGNIAPEELAKQLGEQQIFTWSGHLYADKLIEALGLTDKGGILRVGLTHYNSEAEIDRFFTVLKTLLTA